MDLCAEDVSIVIKDSEEDLLLRNQHLAIQLDEAQEKVRQLEDQLNQVKDAGMVVNMVKKKYATKRTVIPDIMDNDQQMISVLSTMNDKRKRMKDDGGIDDHHHDLLEAQFGDNSIMSNVMGRMTTTSTGKAKFCFSEADDRKIMEAYNAYVASDTDVIQSEHGILKKWQFVADYLQNGATAHQVGRRWREKLDPALSVLKSGTFSQEEDERLLRLIHEHATDGRGGGKNWTIISNKMNRKAKECEHRGATLLSKNQKFGAFSPEEDELLIKLHTESKSYSEMGRFLNRKPKRCADRIEALLSMAKTMHLSS